MKQMNPDQYRFLANQFIAGGQQGNNGTPYGALNAALAGILGGINLGKANRIQNEENANISNLASKFATSSSSADKQAFVSALTSSNDPNLRNTGLAQLLADKKEQPGFALSPGQTRFDASGKVIAALPKDNSLTPYQQERLALARQRVGKESKPLETYKNQEFAKQEAKNEANRSNEIKINAEGARGFLSKLNYVRDLANQLGSDFGPIQGSGPGQYLGKVLNTDSQKLRGKLQSALADLELDVAKLKLKGQGQITESERKIAKETLPNTTQELDVVNDILSRLEQEANMAIDLEGKKSAGNTQQLLQNLKSKYRLQ